MTGKFSRFFEGYILRKAQERWSAAAETAPEMEPLALKLWRGRARQMRRALDSVIHVAEGQLALGLGGGGRIRKPSGTDWAWRPDLWSGQAAQPGIAAAGARTKVSTDISVFHDCRESTLTLRQIRNTREADVTPYGFHLDMFGFDGSFLSMAINFPEAAVKELRLRHILQFDAIIQLERPLEVFARLNVKHGPNTEQIVHELPLGQGNVTTEFDLAYSKIDEKRIERVWLDLIFERPEMNQIVLRDVTVSRRPRAEL
jgi:hypothetical protein